jgi:peptidyl-prolyl cis-trans isomerase SurA
MTNFSSSAPWPSAPSRPPYRLSGLWLAAVLCACCAAAGLARAQGQAAPVAAQQTGDFIVAVVNSEPITNNQVMLRLQRVEQQLSRQSSLTARKDMLRDVLERLISERAQLQLASSVGVRIDDAAVDQAVADVARQNQVSVEELRSRLTADGISLSRFREDLRDELILTRVREREVDARVRVTDLDVDLWLKEQKSSAADGPQEINLAQILVAVPEDANEQLVSSLQAKAQQVLARARAGADFQALAKELSDAPDRALGGELGLRSADRYPPLFVEATRNAAPGALVGPVRSGAGFHVLKVIEKKSADSAVTITQTRARHILLRPSVRLNELAARQRLAEFKRRIVAGQAEFATLAREFSEDGSAKAGGDLGWATPGMFVPEFEQVMNALAPGQLSEPLVSRFGVHLIEVIERRQSELSDRERRELARAQVREKKSAEALQIWLQEVRGRAYVEYRESPQ